MLIIFSFSISPRIFLHNWLAHHKDVAIKIPVPGNQQLGKTLFNCNCDNIVAESPFTFQENNFNLTPFQFVTLLQERKPARFYTTTYIFYTLRGPPAYC